MIDLLRLGPTWFQERSRVGSGFVNMRDVRSGILETRKTDILCDGSSRSEEDWEKTFSESVG